MLNYVLTLGDIADFFNGDRSSNYPSGSDFVENGIPFINAGDIDVGGVNCKDGKQISREAYERLRAGKALSGDVLFCLRGSLGKLARFYQNCEAAIASSLVIIRARKTTDPLYLYYLLQSPSFQISMTALNNGSAQPNLSVRELSRIAVPQFTATEQRQIASILGALDDKINGNRKISETLEAMARAIFTSWFVDFDPVMAKLEGRDTGLAPEIDALFAGSLCDSAHGEIPTGWQWLSSSEAMDVNPSRPLAGIETAPYLDMANVPTQGFSVANVIERRVSSGSRFKNGDTLLARIVPCLENGKTTFVDFLNEGEVAWGSTEFIVIHPRKPLPAEYGYLLAREEKFRNFVIGKATGSVRQRVPVDALNAYFLACPPDSIAKAFSDLIVPIFKRVTASNSESRTLSALRDALLPKLISGELRVSDAKRILEILA